MQMPSIVYYLSFAFVRLPHIDTHCAVNDFCLKLPPPDLQHLSLHAFCHFCVHSSVAFVASLSSQYFNSLLFGYAFLSIR